MKLPSKDYYRLSEVAKSFDCEIDDLLYYAEAGEVKTYVRLDKLDFKGGAEDFGFSDIHANTHVNCFLMIEKDELYNLTRSREYQVRTASHDKLKVVINNVSKEERLLILKSFEQATFSVKIDMDGMPLPCNNYKIEDICILEEGLKTLEEKREASPARFDDKTVSK